MKTFVSAALQEHLAGAALTLAWAWILKRKDGRFYAFTTHVEDQFVRTRLLDAPPILGYPVDTVLCLARDGFSATDIAMTDTLSQNNLDMTSVIGPDGITEEDIRAGLWKNAAIEICFYNYRDLSQGTNTLFVGTLGNITAGDLSVKTEQRGLSQPLEANMDGITSDMCDATLGDRRCGVDLVPFTRTGTIAGAAGDRLFVDAARNEATDWWTRGRLTFTSGASNGQTHDIKRSNAGGLIELVAEVYPGFADGDTYSVTPGCNHLLRCSDASSDTGWSYTGDCKIKFNNVIRFRGNPKVPGQRAISVYGGQSGG